ncbi:hypothetical protein BW727_100985 [Jeotgalibaca dankookensis]|uniref:Uncharacterized protein n=1 Tax=Jeotgalibaca dankookensis TaxID=708126 RepID=A0A1S6IP60_9LACT|nr:hypothetical protein [Jeotgalibaca dankookensis]AQS53355.1 hypothetical protein BW727_100985 [Jeotgalibaca dankookensis]
MTTTELKIVAGTIMVTNQRGESFFLVENNGDSISFVHDKTEKEDKFPMGIIMEALLKNVDTNSDSLRLMDLTNLKAERINIPLFVFDLVERPDNQDDLLVGVENIEWRRSLELKTLLDTCEFAGVPVYNSDSN